MTDDNFPTDTKAPKPIKGTIWAKGQVSTLPRTLPGPTSESTLPKPRTISYPYREEECPGHIASEGNVKVCARCGVHIDDFRPDEWEGDRLTLPKTQPLETLAEVAERLRLEARAGHRKYKGPNVFQHLLRRAPRGFVGKQAEPEVKSEAARNLAMMMTPKGKITRAN